MDLLKQYPHIRIYQVGGSVRDKLLGLPVSDRDWLVTGATPEEMTAAGFKPVGKHFPVFLHPVTHEEYALARSEKKVSRGHQGFTFYTSPGITVEQDLKRRDLTINALAEDSTGKIIDPFNGQADLRNKILRHVSESFTEDPLRVLRVARFFARFKPSGFKIAPETLELMQTISASGELSTLSAERVWQETERALAAPCPSAYFYTLKNCGALEVLFPEINDLFGKPQPVQYHPEIDSGIHTMMVLDRASELSDNLTVRFAALCHDLGKGNTPEEILPSHRGHESRGLKRVQNMSKRLPIPKQVSQFAANVARYHTHLHKINQLTAAKVLKVFSVFKGFHKDNQLEMFAIVCQSDAQGRLNFENIEYPQAIVFKEIATVLQQINTREIVDNALKNDKGDVVQDLLMQTRINAINAYRKSQITGESSSDITA